ncbi:hypothetical protein GGS23DRAFT_543843 [Durotheca rogersii]|uniref:uncharacterized protein n=1 Tax=Durotheca rogersii TaxID=419775 RepID=UPI00222009D7|nr:uncharacterized protein GGS23DRAFT_543843 [Durotheca rogersii]KAI5868064.1 hypothetical protein GGS23DRAFT_543843 [Durotheca rogersii]
MTALTSAQIELANSLTPAELPTKLRCAVCSKLAINAFRLPCCETAICEKCQSTLPSACPVCEHSPVSGSDCTVYKSLRTTIRVFLKTEEKKREAARPKTNGSTPTTPIQDTPTTQIRVPAEPHPPEAATTTQDGPELQAVEASAPSAPADSEEPKATDSKPKFDALPKQDSHVNGQRRDPLPDEGDSQAIVPGGREGQGEANSEETGEDGQGGNDKDQLAQPGMGVGFDSVNGGFNMNFGNGDMNQMQMMLAIQSGMNPAAFGSFPMMGMMDPMTMQNMMMNGGFGSQGMGMNGMNMNMGMNGFNGGGNDWNGQQSWNVGQDNFNPNAPGMGNGDFGNFNSGFRTGFSSGNYGHHNQFNDYRRGNYGYRGRGRGRGFNNGGYGRGYHQGYNNHLNAGWAEQGPQFSADRDVPTAPDGSQAPGQDSSSVDEFGRVARPGSDQDGQPVEENGNPEPGGSQDRAIADGSDKPTPENPRQVPQEERSQSAQGDPASNQGDVSSSSARDPQSGPRGLSRGPAGPTHPQPAVPDVPLNAPTGPKAMRQGLPNTSLHHLRARGYITDERNPSPRANAVPVVASPLEDRPKSRSSSPHSSKDKDRRHRERDRERDDEDKSRGRHRDKDRDRSRTYTISKSRTRSRSRSRGDRKETRRHRRHRSPSVSGDERDGNRRRRKHRSRKQSTRDDDDYKGRAREGKYEERARSASPVDREQRHLSHRSRRDREEKRRDREKEVDKDSDYDRHRKSTHRPHRDRDQDRERDPERERDRDRDRARDHDEDRRHRSTKSSTALPTPTEPAEKSFNPPAGPRGSFSIKGASNKSAPPGLEIKGVSSKPSNSNRRESESSAAGPRSAPPPATKDPHTLEREARDRERLLKEAQRLASRTGVKRGREGGDDRSGRRKSRRSEAVKTEDEEERMRRLEAEREGRRWD